MTLTPGQNVAAAALVLVEAALLVLFVVPLSVALLPGAGVGGWAVLLVGLIILGVPLAILYASRGRRALLAWGVFLGTVVLPLGTCALILSQAGFT